MAGARPLDQSKATGCMVSGCDGPALYRGASRRERPGRGYCATHKEHAASMDVERARRLAAGVDFYIDRPNDWRIPSED